MLIYVMQFSYFIIDLHTYIHEYIQCYIICNMFILYLLLKCILSLICKCTYDIGVMLPSSDRLCVVLCRRRRRPYLRRKKAIHRGRMAVPEEEEESGAPGGADQPPNGANAFSNRRDRRRRGGGGGGRGGRSVWEQRANQLRKRRQMESQEVLFGGSPTEDTTDTPTTAYRAPTLSPDASPGHLPESPMSGIMPMPEPPMSIAIPLPEPPDSEPVPLFTLAEERAVNHRLTGGERRHRVARKSRPGPGGAEEGGAARHRRHRHREARAEAKSRESPHEEVTESGSRERKILEEREEKEEKEEKTDKGEVAEVEGGVSGQEKGASIVNLESEEEHLR